jgi:hypothetical protein
MKQLEVLELYQILKLLGQCYHGIDKLTDTGMIVNAIKTKML